MLEKKFTLVGNLEQESEARLSMVTDFSPECFQECPQMCQPLDGLVSEYVATGDANAIKAKVCADMALFTCMFEGNHLVDCGKVLSAGSALGVQLPTSAAQLQQQCSSSSLRGGDAKHDDMQRSDSNSTDSSTDNSTNGNNANSVVRAGDVSAAGGLGVAGGAAGLLGLLGPLALLFAA